MLRTNGGPSGAAPGDVAAGVSWFGGRMHGIDHHGLPESSGFMPESFPWRALQMGGETGQPVVMIHGFGYDPRARSTNNPHWPGPPVGAAGEAGSFPRWRRDLVPGGRPGLSFGWYSVPLGWRGVLGAWRAGRWNRYRLAWDLAAEAGQALAVMLRNLDGPVDLLCHSLGTRVVIKALMADTALPVGHVVLLNGAEFFKPARAVARANGHVRFVNLVVEADQVLSKLDRLFAPVRGNGPPIGLKGLGVSAPANWIDIPLDDMQAQLWGAGHGWHLQGDNPKKWADHWFTFRHEGNHGLIRAALDGQRLDPPPALGR